MTIRLIEIANPKVIIHISMLMMFEIAKQIIARPRWIKETYMRNGSSTFLTSTSKCSIGLAKSLWKTSKRMAIEKSPMIRVGMAITSKYLTKPTSNTVER